MSERRSYITLEGGVAGFELDEPTERWIGPERGKYTRGDGWGTNLYRTQDAIWIKGIWGTGTGFQNGRGPRLPFRQVTLEVAAGWFHENGVSEPPILFEDLERKPRETKDDQRKATESSVADEKNSDRENGPRYLYADLDGSYSPIYPERPDYFWRGRWDRSTRPPFRLDLFRVMGRWVYGHWTEAGYTPFPPKACPDGRRAPFWEVEIDGAAHWFTDNDRQPPQVFLNDLEHWKLYGRAVRGNAGHGAFLASMMEEAGCKRVTYPPEESDPPPKLTSLPQDASEDSAVPKPKEGRKSKASPGILARVAGWFSSRRVEELPTPAEGAVDSASPMTQPIGESLTKSGEDVVGSGSPSESETPPVPKPDPEVKPARAGRLKEPPREAFEAYDLYQAGWDQTAIAKKMSAALHRTIHQGTVSRWISDVRTWREAGNPWPAKQSKVVPTDPSKLDLGPRLQNNARRKPPQ